MNKRKLIALVISAGVFLMGAGIGTYAWFTSRATSAGKTFTSGKLSINVNDTPVSDAFTIPFIESNADNVKPGDTLTAGDGGVSTITIINNGTLPVATLGKFNTDIGTAQDSLANAILVADYKIEHKMNNTTLSTKTFTSGGFVVGDDLPQSSAITVGSKFTLKDLLSMQDPFGNVSEWNIDGLKKGEEMTISFKLVMDPDAGDIYQEKSITVGYEITATQPQKQAISNIGFGGIDIDKDATDNVKCAIAAAISYAQ